MKKLRAYLDTSVIGGCFDKEFADYSKALFEKINRGDMIAVISDITTGELKMPLVLSRTICLSSRLISSRE
ncbi:MAG: hypothetical protein KAW12_20875 [Candidatus Aminicenantes bacterium]|nr:hypothetical protein [Candidatus Aminicenantes bacterium]